MPLAPVVGSRRSPLLGVRDAMAATSAYARAAARSSVATSASFSRPAMAMTDARRHGHGLTPEDWPVQ